MSETSPPSSRPMPWLDWQIGRRVTIRCHLSDGGYTDVVGEILATSETTVQVRTRRKGDIEVATDTIAIARLHT